MVEDYSEVGAGNWKSPFVDGGEVEQWYCELVEGSRQETRVKYDDQYTGALPFRARSRVSIPIYRWRQ